MRKITSSLLCFILLFQQSGFAQIAPGAFMPAHVRVITVADKFRPVHLRSLMTGSSGDVELLLDKGDSAGMSSELVEQAAQKLFTYFLVGISLPNELFWVNLRPDGEQAILDPLLEKTDVGRIFLEADLQLKKDFALSTSPNTAEGRRYWEELYRKAETLFGPSQAQIPTLSRPWIVPGEILIQESGGEAYIYKATLTVMLEEDHLKGSVQYNFKDERLKALNRYSSELLKKLVIPELTRKVNGSKQYASFRQVYYSLVLAQWFKKKFRNSHGLYSSRIDTKDLTLLGSEKPWSKSLYFKAYQDSFKNGEYNLTQTAYSGLSQSIRHYTSGGITINIENAMGVLYSSAGSSNLFLPVVGYLARVAVGSDGRTRAAVNATTAEKMTPVSGGPRRLDGGIRESLINAQSSNQQEKDEAVRILKQRRVQNKELFWKEVEAQGYKRQSIASVMGGIDSRMRQMGTIFFENAEFVFSVLYDDYAFSAEQINPIFRSCNEASIKDLVNYVRIATGNKFPTWLMDAELLLKIAQKSFHGSNPLFMALADMIVAQQEMTGSLETIGRRQIEGLIDTVTKEDYTVISALTALIRAGVVTQQNAVYFIEHLQGLGGGEILSLVTDLASSGLIDRSNVDSVLREFVSSIPVEKRVNFLQVAVALAKAGVIKKDNYLQMKQYVTGLCPEPAVTSFQWEIITLLVENDILIRQNFSSIAALLHEPWMTESLPFAALVRAKIFTADNFTEKTRELAKLVVSADGVSSPFADFIHIALNRDLLNRGNYEATLGFLKRLDQVVTDRQLLSGILAVLRDPYYFTAYNGQAQALLVDLLQNNGLRNERLAAVLYIIASKSAEMSRIADSAERRSALMRSIEEYRQSEAAWRSAVYRGERLDIRGYLVYIAWLKELYPTLADALEAVSDIAVKGLSISQQPPFFEAKLQQIDQLFSRRAAVIKTPIDGRFSLDVTRQSKTLPLSVKSALNRSLREYVGRREAKGQREGNDFKEEIEAINSHARAVRDMLGVQDPAALLQAIDRYRSGEKPGTFRDRLDHIRRSLGAAQDPAGVKTAKKDLRSSLAEEISVGVMELIIDRTLDTFGPEKVRTYLGGRLSESEVNAFWVKISEIELKANILDDVMRELSLDRMLRETIRSHPGWSAVSAVKASIDSAASRAQGKALEMEVIFKSMNLLSLFQGRYSGTCFGDHPYDMARDDLIVADIMADEELMGAVLFNIQGSRLIMLGFDPSERLVGSLTGEDTRKLTDRIMGKIYEFAGKNSYELLITDAAGGLSNREGIEEYILGNYVEAKTEPVAVAPRTYHPVYQYDVKSARKVRNIADTPAGGTTASRVDGETKRDGGIQVADLVSNAYTRGDIIGREISLERSQQLQPLLTQNMIPAVRPQLRVTMDLDSRLNGKRWFVVEVSGLMGVKIVNALISIDEQSKEKTVYLGKPETTPLVLAFYRAINGSQRELPDVSGEDFVKIDSGRLSQSMKTPEMNALLAELDSFNPALKTPEMTDLEQVGWELLGVPESADMEREIFKTIRVDEALAHLLGLPEARGFAFSRDIIKIKKNNVEGGHYRPENALILFNLAIAGKGEIFVHELAHHIFQNLSREKRRAVVEHFSSKHRAMVWLASMPGYRHLCMGMYIFGSAPEEDYPDSVFEGFVNEIVAYTIQYILAGASAKKSYLEISQADIDFLIHQGLLPQGTRELPAENMRERTAQSTREQIIVSLQALGKEEYVKRVTSFDQINADRTREEKEARMWLKGEQDQLARYFESMSPQLVTGPSFTELLRSVPLYAQDLRLAQETSAPEIIVNYQALDSFRRTILVQELLDQGIIALYKNGEKVLDTENGRGRFITPPRVDPTLASNHATVVVALRDFDAAGNSVESVELVWKSGYQCLLRPGAVRGLSDGGQRMSGQEFRSEFKKGNIRLPAHLVIHDAHGEQIYAVSKGLARNEPEYLQYSVYDTMKREIEGTNRMIYFGDIISVELVTDPGEFGSAVYVPLQVRKSTVAAVEKEMVNEYLNKAHNVNQKTSRPAPYAITPLPLEYHSDELRRALSFEDRALRNDWLPVIRIIHEEIEALIERESPSAAGYMRNISPDVFHFIPQKWVKESGIFDTATASINKAHAVNALEPFTYRGDTVKADIFVQYNADDPLYTLHSLVHEYFHALSFEYHWEKSGFKIRLDFNNRADQYFELFDEGFTEFCTQILITAVEKRIRNSKRGSNDIVDRLGHQDAWNKGLTKYENARLFFEELCGHDNVVPEESNFALLLEGYFGGESRYLTILNELFNQKQIEHLALSTGDPSWCNFIHGAKSVGSDSGTDTNAVIRDGGTEIFSCDVKDVFYSGKSIEYDSMRGDGGTVIQKTDNTVPKPDGGQQMDYKDFRAAVRAGKIRPHAHIVIHMNDGRSLTAEFGGFVPRENDEYFFYRPIDPETGVIALTQYSMGYSKIKSMEVIADSYADGLTGYARSALSLNQKAMNKLRGEISRPIQPIPYELLTPELIRAKGLADETIRQQWMPVIKIIDEELRALLDREHVLLGKDTRQVREEVFHFIPGKYADQVPFFGTSAATTFKARPYVDNEWNRDFAVPTNIDVFVQYHESDPRFALMDLIHEYMHLQSVDYKVLKSGLKVRLNIEKERDYFEELNEGLTEVFAAMVGEAVIKRLGSVQPGQNPVIDRLSTVKDWYLGKLPHAEASLFVRRLCSKEPVFSDAGNFQLLLAGYFNADSRYLAVLDKMLTKDQMDDIALGVHEDRWAGYIDTAKARAGENRDAESNDSGKSEKDGGKGGIDMRSLPIKNQPILASSGAVDAAAGAGSTEELDNLWNQIEQRLNRGQIPFGRMKEYAASCRKQKAVKQMRLIAVSIANILRLEEERALPTTPEVQEILNLMG